MNETEPQQPLGALAVDPAKKVFGEVETVLRDLEAWEFRGGLPDWDSGVAALRERPADAVFVNLDAGLEEALTTAAAIISISPQTTLLGLSETDPGDWLIRGVRSGYRDFLRFPLRREETIAALSRIEQGQGRRRKGQVVTLFSPKGGSGLTTLTVNLGILLAKEQKRNVGLIDLDLEFGDVSFFLNLSPTTTLGDIAGGPETPGRKELKEALVPHVSGVEVLAAPPEIQQAERVSEEGVGRVIREMQEMFDFILINTPSSFSPATLKALDASDTILLVTLPHLSAIAQAKRALDVFRTLGYENRARLVINRLTPEDDVTPQEVEKTLGVPVLMSLPSDYRQVMPAINRGLSLWEYAPRSPVTRAIYTLAQKLTGADGGRNGHRPTTGRFRFF
ncbi:MAG: CpaE family protein [Nitrospinota bacterium]